MKVAFLEQFEKDISRLRDPSLQNAVAKVIEEIEAAKTLRDVRNLKKLKGFKNIYRVRVRDYRLGFIFENGVIEMARFLSRKDIYNLFP